MADKRPLPTAPPVAPRTIVPLLAPAEERAATVARAAPPHPTYHGGPLLTNVQVYVSYWGDAWSHPPLNTLTSKLTQFFHYILKSALLQLLAEYGVPGKPIGFGTLMGSGPVQAPIPVGSVSDGDIQYMLQGVAPFNGPNPNGLYFVYLAPGMVSTFDGGQSCAEYCGYHNYFIYQGKPIYYAVVPYPSCAGCSSGSSVFDSLTKVTSHELCEAITDPMLNGWWDNTTRDEIADLCNSSTTTLGGYVVQMEWSNVLGGCAVLPHWDQGFSGFAAGNLGPDAYIWAYKASAGTVCLHKIAPGGAGFQQTYFYTWDTGFTSFVGFNIGAVPYVWAYRASDRTTCIHRVDGNGFTQQLYYKWDTGFTGFAAMQFSGEAHVWAYRASDGRVCIHRIAHDGTSFTQTNMYSWDVSFTSFVGFNIGAVPYVWAYRASDGLVCIHQVTPGIGNGFTQKSYYHWDHGFTGFTAVNLGGDAYIWAYRASDGLVCIHQVTPGIGNGFTQKDYYHWDTGFSSFAGFTLAGTPYVWAYRSGDGLVCIHRIEAQGTSFTQIYPA